MATNNNDKGTLQYRKVTRTPQTGENAGKQLYYAAAVPGLEMSTKQFVNHILKHGSPFTRGTVEGCLTDILEHLQELILNGRSVRLGELGIFSIGISSRGETSADKVTAQSVQDVHLILRNTKTWSNKSLRELVNIIPATSYNTIEDDTNNGGGDGGGSSNPGSSNPGSSTGGGSTPSGGDSGTTTPGGEVGLE